MRYIEDFLHHAGATPNAVDVHSTLTGASSSFMMPSNSSRMRAFEQSRDGCDENAFLF